VWREGGINEPSLEIGVESINCGRRRGKTRVIGRMTGLPRFSRPFRFTSGRRGERELKICRFRGGLNARLSSRYRAITRVAARITIPSKIADM
jgi:hypothetical protein